MRNLIPAGFDDSYHFVVSAVSHRLAIDVEQLISLFQRWITPFRLKYEIRTYEQRQESLFQGKKICVPQPLAKFTNGYTYVGKKKS